MVSKANRYESIETENHRHESRNTQKKPRKFGFQHVLASAAHKSAHNINEVLNAQLWDDAHTLCCSTENKRVYIEQRLVS